MVKVRDRSSPWSRPESSPLSAPPRDEPGDGPLRPLAEDDVAGAGRPRAEGVAR